MTDSPLFKVQELHDYVLHTTDLTWGVSANRMADRKATFIHWLTWYMKGEYVPCLQIVRDLKEQFPNHEPIADPNGNSSYQRPRWEWALVNIQVKVNTYFTLPTEGNQK
jgi:hypothetical protein